MTRPFSLDTPQLSAIQIINNRRIIGGPDDNLRAAHPVKYSWTRPLWLQMQNNNWFPSEVNLLRDKQQYRELTDGVRTGCDRNLAFLSNLDSIQVNNLSTHLIKYITEPDVKRLMHRQLYEEEVHVDSYTRMAEVVSDDPMYIYDMYRRDRYLSEKNDYITRQAELLDVGEFTEEKFVYAIASNIILEGVFFFNGFLVVYAIARQGKMLGFSDMIKFIQRDELTHLALFLGIWREFLNEHPWLVKSAAWPTIVKNCLKLFEAARQLEATWGKHMIEGGILGLTNDIMDGFPATRSNICAEMMGLPAPCSNIRATVPWFDTFSRINGDDSNNFERRPIDYQAGGGLDWD